MSRDPKWPEGFEPKPLEFSVNFSAQELVDLQDLLSPLVEEEWTEAVYGKVSRALANARRTEGTLGGKERELGDRAETLIDLGEPGGVAGRY